MPLQKTVIILLDEYDTPMQEAYVDEFLRESNEPSESLLSFGDCPRTSTHECAGRNELVGFTRSLFNATFKTNPWLERGIMTGITRVSKESIFTALEQYGLGQERYKVKQWYDGFIFGKYSDIYNPWSILNFLDTGNITTYWANTSSNSLVGKLIREGDRRIKEKFECLLRGDVIYTPIDEQIVYHQLDGNEEAVWSLLLASGYLKVLSYDRQDLLEPGKEQMYELTLTNYEVMCMFEKMVRSWFTGVKADYNDFIKALLLGDKKAMNAYMNRVALNIFSYFDTGKNPSVEEPERFYHGFVLGLIVDLHADEEETLKNTVQEALAQIEKKQYAAQLTARGISKEHIRSYGFAFQGKKVLIG